MNPMLFIVILIVVAFIIFKGFGKSDPSAQACAKEIIQLLKHNPDAEAEEITTIFKAHQRTRQDSGKVTVIVKAHLSQTGILKEEHNNVMTKVRRAKEMLN